jgi:hypothetical protein
MNVFFLFQNVFKAPSKPDQEKEEMMRPSQEKEKKKKAERLYNYTSGLPTETL